MALTEELTSARRAFEEGAWKAGCERWARAQSLGPVPAGDLFRWTTAATLLGRYEDALETLRHGYIEAEAGPDASMSVRFAAWLALLNAITGHPAVASGWLERGASHLGAIPEDCPEAGLLRIPQGMLHLFSGRASEARNIFDQVRRIGTAHHDDDLTGFAHQALGRTALAQCRIVEGLQHLDQR